MIGHPKHIKKCLDLGVDLICAQGGEGGGHTGDVPTSIFIPEAVKMVQGYKSPMTGEQVQIVAAGGMYNGQSLAAALTYGAAGVWVGTRFVLCEEAGAPKAHQEAVQTAGWDDNVPHHHLHRPTTPHPQQRLRCELGGEQGSRDQGAHQQGYTPCRARSREVG